MKLMRNKAFSIVVVFIISFLIILSGVCPTSVRADESDNYSSVMDDLKKDASFDESFYPIQSNDYSLQLIQLAESVNKELFVYVYQPSGKTKDLKASSINISTTINDDISYYNYKLEYLNSSGVFYKYKVVEFTVKDDAARYYAITSIYRPFDESIDTQASGGNTVTETEYAVNKQYCFGEINGKPYVNCVDIETIVVTDKFVGFVRYQDGFSLYVGACDSHFVAFNTDKPIDKLLEADVYYTTQKYSMSWVMFSGKNETFGDKSDDYAHPKYIDKVEHTGGGLFAATYKWDRIQTVEDFIANENKDNIYHGAVIDVNFATTLTDEAMAELQGKKWVLRFAETDYSFWSDESSYGSFSTIVGDVTILRLKFETDGITYNLGVIDNKQTGGKDPSNNTEVSAFVNDRAKTILYLILLILLLVILNSTGILPLIGKIVIFIITAPFKLIGWLIDKFKGD